MKTYNKLILGVISISALALVGCKDKMVEMNTNPDTMLNADVNQLFVGATNNFGYQSRYALEVKFNGVMPLMQYVSRFNADDQPYVNLKSPESKAPGSWSALYDQFFGGYSGQRLYNIVKWIDEQPNKAKYQDVRAICEILSVYQQWGIFSTYGAMVYDEAFKGITDGITQPKYQKLQDVWKNLDTRLKAAVETLKVPAPSDVYKLGTSDFFNGWINTATASGGSTAAQVTDYGVQRSRWLKFGNVFRFEMAWMLAKVEPANFATVSSEVLAVPDGLMIDVVDGTYYNYGKKYDNNPDDVDILAQAYGVGESFMNTLKRLDDPRLPYLARPNGLCPELSPNFMALQQFFPDTIAKYGELFNGKSIYVGKNTNPQYWGQGTYGPNEFATNIIKTFNELVNPKFPAPLTVTFKGEQVEICPKDMEKFSLTLQISSSTQARYFVKCGGKGEQNGPNYISNQVNWYRFDGDGNQYTADRYLLRRPIYTYPQQCFLFAISGTSAGGKSPSQWYAEGVRAAMQELKADALRYEIQVAVNKDYPAIPGTRLATIPYTYDPDSEASAMVAKSPYTTENAMAQAWIYFYNQPEVAYAWWLRTGLLPLKSHKNAAEARAEAVPYLETPYVNASEEMGFPRRGCLPDRGPVNTNYSSIKVELEAQPGFGAWNNTTGRIWWDVK